LFAVFQVERGEMKQSEVAAYIKQVATDEGHGLTNGGSG
jgi:hypothetical protein